MHVSLTAEKITEVGGLPITNSLITTWVVIALLTIFAIIFRLTLKKQPKGIQNIVEMVIDGFHGIVEGVAGDAKLARKFFPTIFTIFLFVLFNNWIGLVPGVGSIGIFHQQTEQTLEEELVIPESEITHELEEEIDDGAEANSAHVIDLGEESEMPHEGADILGGLENVEETHGETAHVESGNPAEEHHVPFTPIFRPGSADLSFTLALAIAAVLLVQLMGVRELGTWGYFKRFLNFKNPIHFFVGLLEIVSEFSKMVSFSFRLFGNIFAGEVLLTVIIALVPFVIPMPFYGLEIFVGIVQALVFSMLTLVFFKGAVTDAH